MNPGTPPAADTIAAVPKKKMVMRSLYVPLQLWEDAKTLADAEGKNISDVVRELLERYVKKGGKR